MNSNQNYLKHKKTIGYLTVSKKSPLYKKTPTKKNIETHYTSTIINNKSKEANNSNINNGYNFLTKYITKKKFQGILDMTSPGNKDVLIDSDSELPPSKNIENINKNIFKKNKCAKLVIDKVESQVPKKNENYYKVIQPNRLLGKNKTKFIFKKNYINRYDILRNALINQNNTEQKYSDNEKDIENCHFLSQTQTNVAKNGYVQPILNYGGYIDNSIQRSNHNSSAKNLYKNKEHNYNIKNNLYNTGFIYNSQSGNYLLKKKDSTLITRNPVEYVRSIEDSSLNAIRDNSSNKYKIYDDSGSGLNIYGADSFYPNKTHYTRFYYIRKNKNTLRNRNTSEESKKSNLYENYRDLIKMNTFSKLNNKKIISKYILYPGFKEKIIRIQSVWRGAYVRELMTFYWNLTNFKDTLNRVIKNNLLDYFTYFIDGLSNYKKVKKKNILNITQKKFLDIKKDDNGEKNIDEYKKALHQKEEDYQNLLKNYNSLVQRCTELQQVVNQMNYNGNNKKEDNNKNEKVIWKELDIDSNNNQKEMNLKNIKPNDNSTLLNKINIPKKFDKIKPEQKDKFDIIQTNKEINIIIENTPNNKDNSNANNNINLRGKKLNKNIYSIERQSIVQYKYNNPEKELNIDQEKKENDSININKSPNKELNLIQNVETFNLINIKPIKEENLIEKQKQIYIEYIKINKKNNKENNIIEKQKSIQYDNGNGKYFYKKYYEKFSSNLNHSKVQQFFIQKQEKNIPIVQDISINLQLLGRRQQKHIIFKRMNNDSFNLINNSIKEKSFDQNSINKSNIIELTIKNSKKGQIELISEKQINSNIEIKGIQKEKKVKDYIIDKLNNDINIIEIKKGNKFKEELMIVNNDIKINIINEKKNNIILSKENIFELLIEKKKETNNKFDNNIIFENDRFELSKDKIVTDFVEEKRDDIILIQNNQNKNQNNNYKIEFIISNNNNLFISKIKKNTSDKMTEITEELNRIEPHNHYELIFEGILNLNENFKNKNNIEEIKNNNNNIIENKKEEILYIPKEKNEKENNKNINYNLNNEIFKGDGIEINPYELKRTKNNVNNIFISYENKLEVLYNKDAIFTEKAKKNMMKIILPIRLKTTLREFVRRNILPLLINNLKKIAMASKMNKSNKIENGKNIKNIFNNYAKYKWNRIIYDLSKEIINNKNDILVKIKK